MVVTYYSWHNCGRLSMVDQWYSIPTQMCIIHNYNTNNKIDQKTVKCRIIRYYYNIRPMMPSKLKRIISLKYKRNTYAILLIHNYNTIKKHFYVYGFLTGRQFLTLRLAQCVLNEYYIVKMNKLEVRWCGSYRVREGAGGSNKTFLNSCNF